MKPLNAKQRKFADGLLEGKTQLEAHRCAGYTPSDAGAHKLAHHPGVVRYVAERRQQAARAVQVDLQWWLERNVLEALGRVNVDKLTPDGDVVNLPDCTAMSRSAALDRIGKYLGAYKAEQRNPFEAAETDHLLKRLPEALAAIGYRLVPTDAGVVEASRGRRLAP